MEMAPLLTQWSNLIFPFLLLFFLPLFFFLKRGNKLNFPPSPPKLPILGHIFHLGKLPHRSLLTLSRKYGPLMFLHLGQSPTLVVSSAEMVKEIMKNHDVVFSSRPGGIAPEILLYGRTDVGFAPYGEYWRQTKKICVVELLSLKRVESFQFVRDEEVSALVEKIRISSLEEASVNLTEMIGVVVNNTISRSVFSMSVKGDKRGGSLNDAIRELMVLLATPSFGDLVPVLGWMDYVTGLVGRLKATSGKLNEFFDHMIEERRGGGINGDDDDKMDFLQILLELQKDQSLGMKLTDDNIKGVLTDMFVGGTDTTWSAIEWTMAELINNPNIMKKAQEEVRTVVGNKPKIDPNDINQMSYLKCVIKEGLRLHAALPLLVPRETTASAKLAGFDIPPKTKVLINVWAIQRDPKHWDRAEEFIPERFEDGAVEFKNPDFKYFPFGGGRRVCPGMAFGVASVECVVANLLYWFDWKLPEKLDMSEACGISLTKKLPLHVVPVLHSLQLNEDSAQLRLHWLVPFFNAIQNNQVCRI